MSSRYKKELVPSNHPSPVCMVTSMSLSEKHHHTEKQTHKAKLCNTCKFSNDLWLGQSCSREVFPFYDLDNDELLELIFNFTTVSASYPDVSLARAKEGGKETSGKKARRLLTSPAVCTLPMVPCSSSPVDRLYLAKNEAPEEEATTVSFTPLPLITLDWSCSLE